MTTPRTAVAPLTLSFMSANYVGTELGYGAADDWGPFDQATNEAFAPIETFAARFEALLSTIARAGYDALDLWTAHLNWRWATPEHVRIARSALEEHELQVVSLAGSFGDTATDLESACRLANALDVDLLGGMGDVLRRDLHGAEAVLREHGVRLGYENHPETTPDQVLGLIGDAADVLGATVDTGWWATHEYDPVDALRELRERLFHVHLKDVERPGAHVTCLHGSGCVDIDGCVEALVSSGYDGALSVEHEPYDRDPTSECIQMREALEARLETITRGGDDER
jgi:sugar phosphate isomerase/epimerase